MTTFQGVLFNGVQAIGVPVQIDVAGGAIVIADSGEAPRQVPIEQVAADAPIPGVRRLLRLPGGELIETGDHAAVDSLWPSRAGIASAAFALESRWWTTLSGLGLTAAAVWIIVAFLLPLAADPVARMINPRVERVMGEHALATLDRISFEPSALTEEEREDLTDTFNEFLTGEADARQYKLQFRKAHFANAFALPGGIIVVSDEMVQAIESDDEFLAVVAHEIGHVRGHHAMRLVLQDSGLAVLMTALAGDAVGTTILAAAIPSVLLRSRYSRQFEAEADDHAFAMLKRHGHSPQAFADMLRRLQKENAGGREDRSMLQYLSSHPATEERIRRAEEQR